MFYGTAQVSHQVCHFFVSSVCLFVLVTMVDKNKAVVFYLLGASTIMLSEKKKRKRKTWSKKWYSSSSSLGATTLGGFWPALRFRSTIFYLYTSLSSFAHSSLSPLPLGSNISVFGLPTGLDEHGSHSVNF
jgi:hypothetical protein